MPIMRVEITPPKLSPLHPCRVLYVLLVNSSFCALSFFLVVSLSFQYPVLKSSRTTKKETDA